jgi:hypothetical protein
MNVEEVESTSPYVYSRLTVLPPIVAGYISKLVVQLGSTTAPKLVDGYTSTKNIPTIVRVLDV